jgi:hypothetical protein
LLALNTQLLLVRAVRAVPQVTILELLAPIQFFLLLLLMVADMAVMPSSEVVKVVQVAQVVVQVVVAKLKEQGRLIKGLQAGKVTPMLGKAVAVAAQGVLVLMLHCLVVQVVAQ